MKAKFVSMSALIVLVACCLHPTQHENQYIHVDVRQQSCELSDLLGSYHYTVLETCNEGLVSEIDKIELANNRIYILDSRQHAVLIFDGKGRFVNRIMRMGRGPGEYIGVTDMIVRDSIIHLLSRDKIILYKEDGKWLHTIPLDDVYNHFHMNDDGTAWLYSGHANDTKFDFALLHCESGTITERFAPFEQTGGYISRYTVFHPTVVGLRIAVVYDYNIYSLSTEGLSPKYTLEFNTSVDLPSDHSKRTHLELYDELANKNVVSRVDCIDESDGWLLFTFSLFHDGLGVREHVAFLDKRTGETKQYRIGDKIDGLFPYFGAPKHIRDGQLVCASNAVYLINMENAAGLSHFKNILSETDNPVIFFYKIKGLNLDIQKCD